MSDRKEMIKQIKWLIVILSIVIAIAIFVNVRSKPLSENNTVNQEEIKIDGLTEEEIERARELIDTEDYIKYKETFKDIREGNIPYYEGMTLKPKNLTDEESEKKADEIDKKLKEADENGSWHYFTLEDGTVTNTIIYDDIDIH